MFKPPESSIKIKADIEIIGSSMNFDLMNTCKDA